jgi:hypothetical protein
MDDTLERVAQWVLAEFYERHLQDTAGTSITLLPLRDEGNQTWSSCMATACDTAWQTYHEGWSFTARYAQHVGSLLQEVKMVGMLQCVRLVEYNHQVEAKDYLINGLKKGRVALACTLPREAQ